MMGFPVEWLKFRACIIFLAFMAGAPIAGCGKEAPEVEPQVRAIKSYTVTEMAEGQTRSFSGVIHAEDSSTLSFQVDGNVQEMRVQQGEQVEQGQVLAVLDKQPYELDVQSAEADLQKARAELAQAREEYERQKTLYEKGWVAKARLDRNQSQLDSAISQVDYATSKLELAKRHLRLTDLTSPYDGVISRKYIDAFVEVKTGQPVYEIEASGELEVRFQIPETIISRITLDMPVAATFATKAGDAVRARVSEVGTTAGEANAFDIKARLIDPPPEIRSGMTVEVSLLLKEEGERSSYLVPFAAIAPADQANQGFVFTYDPKTETVKKTPIKAEGTTDNLAHVYEGVAAGDILAAAGVSFLADGQQVKLMDQSISRQPVAAAGSQ